MKESENKKEHLKLNDSTDSVVMRLLLEMFEADTEYGCGFYNYEPWRIAYAKLQKIAGYKRETSVFDSDCDEFDGLSDS